MAFRRVLAVMAVIALSVNPVAAQTIDEQSLQIVYSDDATPFVRGSVSEQFGSTPVLDVVPQARGMLSEHTSAFPHDTTVTGYYPAANTAIVLATHRYGEAERIAAVGRHLTTPVIDGSTSELPASSTRTLLGTLGVMIALHMAGIVIRLIRRRVVPHTVGGAAARGVFAVVLGAAAVYTVVIGVSAFAGAPLSVVARWAPDVTLLVWILIGTIVVATALGVITQVIGYRRGRSSRINP